MQRPWPPLLIGGGGKRVLSFAAREADIIGINATLTSGAIGAGGLSDDGDLGVDRFDDIEMNIRTFMVNVTDQRTDAMDKIAGAIGVEPSMIEASPFALVGSTQQLVEDLLARRERWGFSYVIVGAEDIESFAPVVAALSGT